MDQVKITEYARALYNAHGDNAEVEASQKIRACEDAGKTEEAENWRSIRNSIHTMRGPNQG